MPTITNISTPQVILSWNNNEFDSTTSITVPAGTDYLVIRVGSGTTTTGPSGIEYDGSALTRLSYLNNGNGGGVGIYYLKNPPIGTFDLYITKTQGSTYQFSADAVSNAAYVGTAESFGSYNTGSTNSLDIETISGDLVLDVFHQPDGNEVTVGADQSTQLLNLNEISASSKTATSTTTTMSWGITPDFVAHSAVAFSSTAPLSITDVDSDDIITNGQTGVVISGNTFGASGTVTIDGVTQTVTAWSDTAITITHVRGSMKYGAQTLSVTNDSAEVTTHNITVNPATGYSYVDLSGYVEETADITGTPSLIDGDQLEYDNIAGAFSVSISPLGLVTLTGTGSPAGVSFDVIAWDASNTSWGSTSATYTSAVQNPKINQLVPANYVPAKMPMHLIFPRVDAETDAYARQKFAHTGMDYRIPVGIQGGAWPFLYEVISGPTGLTVGENHGDTDYGVVNWSAASVAAASAGPHSVIVRVTDQEGSFIDAVWSIAVDDSQFVFIDSNTSTSGTGTIENPLKLFTDWYEGSITSTTYQDKICVFRAGTYTVTGEGTASNGNNVDYQAAFKTRSIIGYPGETATLDHGGATGGGKWVLNTEYHDFFVSGLTFYNARQDVDDAHFFWLTNSPNPGGDRVTFHENVFDTCDYGTAGIDNAGPILLYGNEFSTHRENLLLKGNTSTNITPTGNNNGHSLATIFLTNYVLVEGNIGYGNDVGLAVNAKGTEKFVTIRANNFDNHIAVNLGNEVGPRPPHDHEVCWNKVIIADGAGRGVGNVLALMYANDSDYAGVGGHYNDYIYRNTFKGASSNVRFAGDELYEVEGNIVEHSANNFNGRWNPDLFKAIDIGRENLFVDDIEDGSFNTAFTDASGNLFDDADNGNARTTYLGTKGAEVVIGATAVIGVTATAVSMDQINISWTPDAGAGLSIERSLNGTSNWEEVYFCPSDDGDGQGNSIVKLFSHLPNTQYFYRLRHCVSSGESSSYGEYSYIVNATTTAANNIYYVAPSGGSNSNDGLSGSPFATVQHAIDAAVPGDIIRLQAGTHTTATDFFTELYYGPVGTASDVYSIADFDKSGTEALPYILEADPGATVVLDCQAGTFRYGGLVGNIGVRIKSGNGRATQSHIHIKNIEMRDVRGNGVHFVDNSPAHDDLTVGMWAEGIVLENLTVNRLWGSNFLQKYVRVVDSSPDGFSDWVAESPPEYRSHRDDTYPTEANGNGTNWYDDTSTSLIRWNFIGVNNAAYRVDNTRNSIFRNIKANDCYWNDQDNTDPIGRAGHVAGIHWYGAWNNLVENCVFKDIGSVGIFQKAGEDNTPASGWSVVARYNIVDSAYTATMFQLANVGEDNRFKLYNNILKNYYAGVTTGKDGNLDQAIVRNNVFDADGSFWGYGTAEFGFGISGPNDENGIQQSVDTAITGNIFNSHKEHMILRVPIATGMVIDYNIYDTGGKWQIDVYNNHGGKAEYQTLTQWQTNTDILGVQHLTSDFRPVSPDANSVEFTALTEVFTNSSSDDYTIPAGSDAFNLISASESAGPYQYGGETIGSTTIVATPTISISSATQTVEVGGTYTVETATVYDAAGNVDSGAVVTVTGDTVDTNTVGTYTVYFDTPGAPQVIQLVYIADTNIPTITVDTSTQTIEVGGAYIPPSAMAADTFYGDLTSEIVVNNTVDVNTVGSYSVTWDVDDINGNSAIQQIQTVNVVDTVIPEIQLNDAAVKTIEYGTYIAPPVTATDNYDNNATLTSNIVNTGDVITSSTDLGTYVARYNVSDSAGNNAVEVTQTVTIQDTIVPVLNLNAPATINVDLGSAWSVPNVTATDTYDDDTDLTSEIVQSGTVNTGSVGIYTATWNVTDSNGNIAVPVSQTINVVDIGAPTISLNRSLTQTVEVGSVYSAPVPTAFDNSDGDITSSIVETGDSLSSSSVGTFTRTYNVTDSNGNDAAEVVYTLTVEDTIKPVITIPLTSRTLEFGEYVAQTVTATDNFYGSIPVVTTGDAVNPSSLPGTYTIRYNAIDQNGLEADEVVETITIVDTTPPVINLVGSNNVDIEIDSTYSYPNVTATDAVDGNIIPIRTGVVDTSTLGTYSITWNCNDAAGNAAVEVVQTVNVVDTQIPVINRNAPAVIYLDIGTPYIIPNYNATDQNGSINLTSNVVISGDTVNENVPGTYVVRFNVSDASNNSAAEVTQTIIVQEAATGATRVTTWPTQTSPTGNEVFAIDDGTTFKKMTLDEITAYIVNAINNP